MKKLISLMLSIAMMITLIGTMAVSSSAETITKTVNILKGGVWQDGDLVYTTGIDYDSTVKEGNRVIYTDGSDRPETGNNGLMIPVDTSKTYTIRVTGNSIPWDIQVRLYQYKADKTPNMFRNGNRNFSQTNAGQKTATLTTGSGGSLTNYLHSDTAYIIVMLFKSSDGGATTANNGIKVSDLESNINVQITYDETVELAPTTDAISTSAKASIRLGTVSGIRFYTTFDASKIEGTVVEKGTLIGPSDLIGDELTIEDEKAENAVAVTYLADTLWDGNEFVGSIVGIQEKNYNRGFTARAYVKLDDGTYLYSAASITKTVADIADAYIADPDSNYATLDTETKSLVDAWAAAND